MTGRAQASSTEVLRAQWAALRGWVETIAPARTADPSVLPGWSVADLVAHLGRALDALTAARPAPPDAVPQSVSDYVGGYAAGAEHISEVTHALAAEIAADPLAGLDRLAGAALARVADQDEGRVVLARRGPIRLGDLVRTRVLELVVHGDDLTRSLPDLPPAPLLAPALHVTSEALLDVLRERTGQVATARDELAWVRLACGRTPATPEAVVDALHLERDAVARDVVTALPLL